MNRDENPYQSPGMVEGTRKELAKLTKFDNGRPTGADWAFRIMLYMVIIITAVFAGLTLVYYLAP